jgi:hypothetical protein
MADAEKSLPELGRELVDMTVAYAKQETVGPLKELKGYVVWGVGGAAVGALGLVFFLLGLLRLLQVEGGSYLDGRLSWIPYLITMAVAVVATLISAKNIKGDKS